MKLTFQKDALLNGINIVLKAVPSKTTMSILECILIDASGFMECINVLADTDNLSEALSNILVNGWEATLSASRSDPVQLAVSLERLWVSITIQDNGTGIPKEAQHRIWEPFYSIKNSSSNWGMGMYFARSIIRMHLGSVRFETRMGRGTRFIILLPRYDRREENGCQD